MTTPTPDSTRVRPRARFSMRRLLMVSPSLAPEAQRAIASGDRRAREYLRELGANDCEAAELLDEPLRAGC